MMRAVVVPALVVAVSTLALVDGRRRSLLLAATLAPALAFGFLSLGFFTWRFLGAEARTFGPVAWIGLTAAAAWTGYRWATAPKPPPQPASGRPRSPLLIASVLVATLVAIAAFWLHARQSPVGQFDAWAIWSSRARLLYLAPDLREVFSLLRRAHPDYPLFLPASLAAQFSMLGDVSREIPLWTGAVFPVAAAAAVALGVTRLGGTREWGWAAAALLLATPQMTYWGFSQCADVPLAYLLALAALSLATCIGGEGRPIISHLGAGFFTGLLAWAKNEGMILSLLLLGLFGCFESRTREGRARMGRVTLGAVVPWLAVLCFKIGWKPRSDLPFFVTAPWRNALSIERWRYVGASFLERLDPISGFLDWGIVWFAAAVALLMGALAKAWRRRSMRFILLAVGACWITWFAVFLATPMDIEWHVRTALDRLMLQLLPLTLMAGFASLAPPFSTGKIRRSGVPSSRGPAIVSLCLAVPLLACSGAKRPDPALQRLIEQPPAEALDLATLYTPSETTRWFRGEEEKWYVLEGSASPLPIGLRLSADSNRHASMWRRVGIEASRVDAVVVRSPAQPMGMMQLYWAPPDGTFTPDEHVESAAIHELPSGEFEIVFAVREAPGWRGTIDRIRFTAVLRSQQPDLVVTAVEAVRYSVDRQAVERASATPWILELGRERRYGYVGATGRPLSWEPASQRGNRLTFGFGAATSGASRAVFRVATAEGHVLFEATVGPGGLPGGRWHDGALEISGAAAGSELRFESRVMPESGDRESTALALWGGAELAATGAPDLPNILLVSIDTLRPDHLSLYGYHRPTSPHLDRWAQRATVFETVVTTSPWTLPAHLSMFTGLDALHHGVNHRVRSPASLQLVAETLREAGYRTVAITGGGYLDPEFGLDQGFDSYRYWPERAAEPELEEGIRAAMSWVENGPRRPWFLFFHTYEVHYPYRARQPFHSRLTGNGAEPDARALAYLSEPRTRDNGFVLTKTWRHRKPPAEDRPLTREELDTLIGLYDSGIAYTDDRLAPLLETVDAREDTVIVVTSDHGEALGEHGLAGHAYVHDSNALVPLVIKQPGQRDSRRVTAQVRSTDLMPTLLALAELPVPSGLDGASLIGLMEDPTGATDREATIYASFANRGLALRLGNRWKYVFNNAAWPGLHGQNQLFDLRADPAEGEDRSATTEGVDALAQRARSLSATIQGALLIRFIGSPSRSLAGTLSGTALNVTRLRSPALPEGAVRWEPGRGAVLSLPSGTSFDLLLENPTGRRLRLELEPDLVAQLDLGTLSSPLRHVLVAGAWISEAKPGEKIEAEVTVEWAGATGRATDPGGEDAELREQLRALGYVE